jgi:hypothetical protein
MIPLTVGGGFQVKDLARRGFIRQARAEESSFPPTFED